MPSNEPLIWHALSVRQPYAELIVRGIKRYEARTWEPRWLGGAILIHASQSLAAGWRGNKWILAGLKRAGILPEDVPTLSRSALIGAVDVVGFLNATRYARKVVPVFQRRLCYTSDPDGDFLLWKLRNAVAFERPIRSDGKLGLWSVSQRVTRLVDARLPEFDIQA